MTVEITAFATVPDFARGFVKDLRVRWALEEAGIPYTERLLESGENQTAEYRRRQPFAQVPVYRDDEIELFETGAILLYLARKNEALAPRDVAEQARAASWVLAALNSVEPFVSDLVRAELLWTDRPWVDGFREVARESLGQRLTHLSEWLGDGEWLEGRFTVGDIMMVTVLRDLIERDLGMQFPNLDAYRIRGEMRPAFQHALKAQLDAFERYEEASA